MITLGTPHFRHFLQLKYSELEEGINFHMKKVYLKSIYLFTIYSCPWQATSPIGYQSNNLFPFYYTDCIFQYIQKPLQAGNDVHLYLPSLSYE